MSQENKKPSEISSLRKEFLNEDSSNPKRIISMNNFIELGGQLDGELIYSLAQSIAKYTKALYWDKISDADGTLANAAAFTFFERIPENLYKYAYQKLERIPLVMDNKVLHDLHQKKAELVTHFRSASKEKV